MIHIYHWVGQENKMKKLFRNLLIIITLAVLILQPYVLTFQAKADEDISEGETFAVQMESDNSDDPGDTDEDSGRIIDNFQKTAENLELYGYDRSNTLASADDEISKISNLTNTPRLVFNSSDLQDLRILYCLGNVVPDFANHDDALATATGKSIEAITNLRLDRPADWKLLIEQAQEASRKDIVSRLKYDLANFACIAGLDETAAADMLAYDQQSADAIIDYAQNKVIIDRRVIALLVNLVTPKDQGGSGHERIKIYRLRNGYNRDARVFSRESDATYQQMAQDRRNQLNTVADVSVADRDTLDGNREFAASDVQAEVVNAAGRSEGELIFSDTEDEQNISAHSRGQAIDVSEIDNMKCTLIGKKRIGGDKKKALPPTPIKIAWQTTEGYDRSPPTDYSSLQMNLRQIASGQYLDMLDELGIDSDSEEDLSDATFSDIVSLIGESLLAEILNSPSNSLRGYSLSDTVKKIGGMILADKLELPRAPFIEADLTDFNDLKAKVGEAVFEKKLNIAYGSIRGNNLDEILQNVGLRFVERQLDVPTGTITPGMSAEQLKLAIGRRIIDREIRLSPGTFQSDTTFQKLKGLAGERKIDLIFTNPSEVDEILGLDINENYSGRYKAGDLLPDPYALLVGGKVLADNAYIYNYTTSSANALRLNVDTSTGSEGMSGGQNSSTLSGSTSLAKARFNWIMSGNLTPQEGNAPPASFNDIYKAIGIETIAAAMTPNSETRTAISQWLLTNSLSSQQNCAVPTAIQMTIPKPGGTAGETIIVTIPEDQIMATFGLRRGDLARLFGCYNTTPEAVFRGLGERTLYNALLNSTTAERIRTQFLADHPEITNFLSDVQFYRTRIETIRDLSRKIKNDWNGANSGNPELQAIINQVNSSADTINGRIAAIDTAGLSLTNIANAMVTIRDIPVIADRVLSAIETAQRNGDQSLLARANATLSDITTIIHSVDEILSGEDQPEISSLRLGSISVGSSGLGGGVQINVATLALMLAGRLSPKDFLISIGSNMIEESLNLPTNGILYFAKYLDSPSKDVNDLKSAFFRAIGQAQLEETFAMPPFFFQGDNPAANATLTDVKVHVARSFGVSDAEAGARIMRALGLPGEFSTVERQQISSISSVVLASNTIDGKLGINQGTTANFLNGSPVNVDTLGNSDIMMLAGAFGLPEQVIQKFVRVKTGKESIEQAMQANFASEISFNAHNPFADKPAANSGDNLADQCPITFSYDPTTKTFSSRFIQDSSYIYNDRNGTHSFPSLADARNYVKTVPDNNKIDFVEALAIGVVSGGSGTTSQPAVDSAKDRLKNFAANQQAAEAFPDTDLIAMADSQGIPLDTVRGIFTRNEITQRQENAKPINFYLELVGRKTAERRIVSALLGSLTMTFAGLRIDATDIFDILNGNSLQVAYRIGGRFLEEHFNISPNLVMAIIEAPNTILKNCSLAKIGGNILGSVLGVGSVSLSGNIYENIGGAKIEQALGLPAMSFRGSSVDELITNLGAAKFADVFGLPANIIAPTSITTDLLGTSGGNYLASLPYGEQIAGIDNVFNQPDFIPTATPQMISTAMSSVDGAVRNFIKRSDIWNPVADPNSSPENYQLYNFQQRVAQIDSMVGVSSGKTKQMLSGGITPDDYRREAANNVLLMSAGNILTALGLGDFANLMVQGVALVTRFQDTMNMIKACADPDSSQCDRAALFDNLQMILGTKFDTMLGLPPGTIAAIITDPQQAAYQLISGALRRLDNTLGLVDENGNPSGDASFTSAFAVWRGLDSQGRPSYKNCDTDPQNCLSNDSNDNVWHGFSIENRWQIVAENIAGQLIGNYLNKIGIIFAPPPGSGPYAGFPDTQTLIRESANMLIHGDLRILAISASIMALQALHLYEDSDNFVPEYFRVSFEDVYYAFMGDPVLEQQYVNTATDNFAYNWSQGETYAPPVTTDQSEMTNGTNPVYGGQCWPGESTASCVDPSVPGSDYSFYENSGSFMQSPDHLPAGIAPSGTMEQVAGSPDASQSLAAIQEHARSQARNDTRNNLLWRMADAQLYRLDQNIPVGFTRTMFTGTGKQRTMMLLLYASNALNLDSIEIGGISVGEIVNMLPILTEAIRFFDNPATFDLDAFVQNGNMAILDGWLTSKFSGFLGFDLPQGTFTALFYGFKTGNFMGTDGYYNLAGTNIKIPSITTIISDWATAKITAWADKALGLPQGTVYTAYTMYRGLVAARVGLAKAIATGDATKIAAAKANVVQIKAELITFIITTVFAKQIAAVETALGLVPGTGGMVVGMAVSYLMTGAIPWITIAMFIIVNLFGVYKSEVWCTADGYYPRIESPPDPSVYDNGSLGEFEATNANSRKNGYIGAARYKARIIAGDALMLPERLGDDNYIPAQIMVGRQEDADYWQYKINDVICASIGGSCEGTRAGMWKNPQTTAYTHIGY